MKKFMAIGALALALAAGATAGVTGCSHSHTQDAAEAAIELSVDAAVLRQGSTGGEVREVQRRLKQWGYYTGAVDGIWHDGPASGNG